MKRLILILALISVFLALPVFAQTQDLDRIAFTGAGYFDGSQVKGLAGFLKQLGSDSKIYNITETQIGLVPKGLGNIHIAGNKDLQADISSGLLYDLLDYKGYSIFGLGEPGLQQTGDISSVMLKAGGGIHKFLYKDRLGIAVFGTWKYAQDPVLRVMQWQVNPSFALTFRF
jgi:hypothetical protein